MNRMIATYLVIGHALVFTGIFVLVEAFPQNFSEWVEAVIIIIMSIMFIGLSLGMA